MYYTNPMVALIGYIKVNTVGLSRSMQVCSEKLLEALGMEDKLEELLPQLALMNITNINIQLVLSSFCWNDNFRSCCKSFSDLIVTSNLSNQLTLDRITQLLTIEAAKTRSKDKIHQAAMLDPHTAAELSIDDIKAMRDEMLEAHDYMKMYQ